MLSKLLEIDVNNHSYHIFLAECCQRSNNKKYHLLGRETLWSEIKYLQTNDKQWNYYHYDSKCIERDSKNKKLYNNRAISNENIDEHCQDKYLFIPIYNTIIATYNKSYN